MSTAPRFPQPGEQYDRRNEVEFRRLLAAHLSGVRGLAGISTGGAAATALANLTDVNLTGQVDGNFLKRSSGLWVPSAIAQSDVTGLVTGLSGLSAVDADLQDQIDALAAGTDSGGYGSEHAGTTDIEVWYSTLAWGGSLSTTISSAANVLRLVPFIAPARGGTLDRFGVDLVTGVASNNLRVGLYSSKSATNLYPDALLDDSGNISSAVAGPKSATVSRALTPGRVYWLGVVTSATLSLRAWTVAASGAYNHILGLSGAGGAPPGTRGWYTIAHAFGALPSTIAAGISPQQSTVPMFQYRFSA